MSEQRNRPPINRGGGRGRGGYSGQNRGGNWRPQGTPQRFQNTPPPHFANMPPNYPPQMPNCPPQRGQHDGIDPMLAILSELGMGSLFDNFAKDKVGPREVESLSAEEFQSLGVETIGDRARLKQSCKDYLKGKNKASQNPAVGNQGTDHYAHAQGNSPPTYPPQYQPRFPPQRGTSQIPPLLPDPQLPPRSNANYPPPGHGAGYQQPQRDRPRGLTRGRGRGSQPPYRGAPRQSRSGSMDRKALLKGDRQKSLSLVDISIANDDDTNVKTQEDIEGGQMENSQKKKKKSGQNKKSKAKTDDHVEDEATLRDVLSGLDSVSACVTVEKIEQDSDREDKTTSDQESRKKRQTRGNKKKKDKGTDEETIPSQQDDDRKTSESDDSSTLPPGPSIHDVFDFVVKEMHGKGTPEEIRRKSGLFPSTFTSEMVEQWFKQFYKRFKSIMRDDRVVCVLVYDREMNYCLDYITRRTCTKERCQRYHICKDFLCGACRYGPKCNKSHDFFDQSSENLSISKRLGFTKRYNNQQVLALMQCRYPSVCHEWNRQKACTDSTCVQLHMCEQFLLGRCKDEDCIYGHHRMTDHNRPVVDAYQMRDWKDAPFNRIIFTQRSAGTEERDEFHDALEDITDDTMDAASTTVNAPTSPNAGEDNTPAIPVAVVDTGKASRGRGVDASKTDEGVELCDQYLIDKCNNNNCAGYHNESLRLPYLWQVRIENQWIDCSQSEEIEKEFCARADASEPFYVKDSARGISELVAMDFTPTIKARLLDEGTETRARRLSTKSYKEKGQGKTDARTQWRWYSVYNYGEIEPFQPDTLQHTLEAKYLAGQREYQFLSQGLPSIDFTAMCLVEPGGKYSKILRLPLLVTASDVQDKKRPPILAPDVPVRVTLPKDWMPWDTSSEMELVRLAKGSDQYDMVEDRLFEHLKRHRYKVEAVFHVQNYTLWDQFTSKEKSMQTALQRANKRASDLDKRYLYHGTGTFEAVKGICRSNIDPRRSGENDTKFGEGAYFAAEARLANQYTLAPDHYVFVVNVLVGEFCKGERGYRMPPAIPGTDREYDSCVDDVNDPTKFVLFDRNQYYPEYLIWYRDADEEF